MSQANNGVSVDVGAIDPNMNIAPVENAENIIFREVQHAPFQLYGVYYSEEHQTFLRMPPETAATVNEGVLGGSSVTAGGRVRFSTDSSRIIIRTLQPELWALSRMPLTGTGGFDLYEDKDGESVYLKTFIPPLDMKTGQIAEITLSTRQKRSFTIHFPLYSAVSRLEIGLEKDAVLKPGKNYLPAAPIVYYGSSITQGGCVSRPGNAYPTIISRRLNRDFINLGFAGNAKGETEMANYLASLDMSVFVCDYDYNAPDEAHLKRTLLPFVETVRCARPHLPIIMVSRPNFHPDNRYDIERREIVRNAYEHFVAFGDARIRFVDGATLFGTEYRDCCTVDDCHPNDAGMLRMAKVIGDAVAEWF